jgi:hypothetical protein
MLRFLWNAANEQRIERMHNPRGAGKRWLSAFDQHKELATVRNDPALSWLAEVPSAVEQKIGRAHV